MNFKNGFLKFVFLIFQFFLAMAIGRGVMFKFELMMHSYKQAICEL